MTDPTLAETRWKANVDSFERNHENLKTNNPDCQEEVELLGKGLQTIEQLIHTSPSINGNGGVWNRLIAKSEAERIVLCKHLDGTSKALFTAMLRLYACIHREMRELLLEQKEESTEEFREQRRRKRNPSEEQNKKPKPSPNPRDPRIKSQVEVPTRNFFATLRTTEMDVAEETTEKEEQQSSCSKSAISSRCTLATIVVGKDLDIFADGAVSLNHILQACTKPFTVLLD
ncbi:uncharacterized protein LOC111873085 isoform X2 [Cryptotermes secundus]|uniref:uncharacterized protein LOC111873085 isoform X2 n=1 Tax=Cryptotermes secundus TaxID=105785 RepID=UPI001454E31E|nr:uncharacterized protein LOC111873085 isoform X2 [Cryptotermes secundus]